MHIHRILFCVLLCLPIGTMAQSANEISAGLSSADLSRPLDMRGLFTYYARIEASDIRPGYRSIHLSYRGVSEGAPDYEILQRCVYIDALPDRAISIPLGRPATEDMLQSMLMRQYGMPVNIQKNQILTLKRLLNILSTVDDYRNNSITSASGYAVLDDVYRRLHTESYTGASLPERTLIDGAIRGLVSSVGDHYASYFSPKEATVFREHLSGTFDGIGAEVSLIGTWQVVVVRPLPGGPADHAGMRAGDRIVAIDGVAVTADATLMGIASALRWPVGSTVAVTISRDDVQQTISIIRGHIDTPFVTYAQLDTGDSYIRINTFGDRVAKEFSGALDQAFKTTTSTGKIIIDLRDNPGGEMDQAADMLGHFVPQGRPTIHIESPGSVTDILSSGDRQSEVSQRHFILLLNGQSASAAEIFAVTIRDYLHDMVRIVGERSYGKGTMQSYHSYPDTSAVKYTIAHWMSGRTHQNIDGIGILPDIVVKPSIDHIKKNIDDQLEYAKKYTFSGTYIDGAMSGK